jgi:integrase
MITPKRPKRASRKLRITELTIRKARPGPTAFLIWDVTQRGLALRIEPTGTKVWKCIFNRHNRTRWMTIGRADAISLADARLLAGKAMVAVAEGRDPAAEKRAQRSAGSFAELAAKYVEQHSKKHNKSWRQADALIRGKVLPKWGKLQATIITRSDVKALMASIAAPIAANQTLAAVSAVFTWGMREEIVTTNPCKLIARHATTERERVLSESEVPAFWRALDDVEPAAAAALKTILLTGQRPGEVSHIRREHIVDKTWWELPGKPVPALSWPGTKNAVSHRIALSKAVQEIIAEDETVSGFVFAGPRGGPVRGLDAAMREVSAKLGGAPLRPHDLRRTFGSTVTALGFGRQAMDRILNHADHSIGSIYDRHAYAREDRHIMETVASRIMALVAGRGGAADNVVPLRS